MHAMGHESHFVPVSQAIVSAYDGITRYVVIRSSLILLRGIGEKVIVPQHSRATLSG
jgi:hypothetical protein